MAEMISKEAIPILTRPQGLTAESKEHHVQLKSAIKYSEKGQYASSDELSLLVMKHPDVLLLHEAMANLLIAKNGLNNDALSYAQKASDQWKELADENPFSLVCRRNLGIAKSILEGLKSSKADDSSEDEENIEMAIDGEEDKNENETGGDGEATLVEPINLFQDWTLVADDMEMEDLHPTNCMERVPQDTGNDDGGIQEEQKNPFQEQIEALTKERDDLWQKVLVLQDENMKYKSAALIIKETLDGLS